MQAQLSANEDYFFIPKARNSPIKASFTSVQGTPEKLKIYRIAGSKYWQVRIFITGKYISKSLKTTEIEEAQAIAKIFYEQLVNKGITCGLKANSQLDKKKKIIKNYFMTLFKNY